MRQQRMCPNQDCQHYQQPVTVLGGCECGTALVPYYIEPTDEQLERFAMVMMRSRAEAMGVAASDLAVAYAAQLAMMDPQIRATMLREHRAMQMEANKLERKR